MEDRYWRNATIDDLLEIWTWCSRHLHVKWQRKRKQRNNCFYGLAFVASDQQKRTVAPMRLLKGYKKLLRPILTKKQIKIFWRTRPMALLELCLGAYTKGASLSKTLEHSRSEFSSNPILDDLAKKMRCREKRFGEDWSVDGHHPESEYRMLKKEMRPLCAHLQKTIANEPAIVSALAFDVLAQGWQFGDAPASCWVRRTPEKLLNRANRLKLWQTAQEVLEEGLEEEELLEVLCNRLTAQVSPAMATAIKDRDYTISALVDDFIRFDVIKSRDEITS
jgi:hypothetical protein